MQVLDGMVVLVGLYVFGLRPSMYAIVTIFISSKVTDTILEGMKFSKAAYIITDKYEEIAKRIMETLDRGVTGLEGRGMYSGERKCIHRFAHGVGQFVQPVKETSIQAYRPRTKAGIFHLL